jgi:hypothetical protein
MSPPPWIVEWVLPAGAFIFRPLLMQRPAAELDLDVHSSVAELLAWKHDTTSHSPMCGHPIFEEEHEPPLLPHRFLVAHCEGPALAARIASDLHQLIPRPILPWSEGMWEKFMRYMQGIRAAQKHSAGQASAAHEDHETRS